MFTKSGIYTITHDWTGIVYVGRSPDMFGRWRQHYDMLVRGVHHCHALQSAWNEYDEKEFIFGVYQHCAPDKLVDREKLCIRDLQLVENIKLFNSECNPTPSASRPGGARLTDEQAREIKRRHLAGESGVKLAEEYDICSSTVYALAKGRFYKDISVLEG